MLKRERFDIRFPPEAWSNPDALRGEPSRRYRYRIARYLRNPRVLVGASLAFVALTHLAEPAPTREVEVHPPTPPAERKTTQADTKLVALQQHIGHLTIARSRLERAARVHESIAKQTGDRRAAEAADIIWSVRDRHDKEIDEAIRAANVIIDSRP